MKFPLCHMPQQLGVACNSSFEGWWQGGWWENKGSW